MVYAIDRNPQPSNTYPQSIIPFPMLHSHSFTFNPYQENTYVLWDDTQECVIIDPGCYSTTEQTKLRDFIEEKGLKVVKLLNTHGHIDHMLGNDFVVATWQIPFETHEIVVQELEASLQYGPLFGLNPQPSPKPSAFLNEGDMVSFGDTILEVFFTPGHSPGHISFFHHGSEQLFSGDVLFQGSIGRVDLPGGSMDILMDSIINKLLPLGDTVMVYPGHGPTTTLGREKLSNPFVLEYIGRV